jgi:proteasome lid subunit RPN8/RPN11
MKIQLNRTDYSRIIEHAKAGLPNEVCGLIAGTIAEEVKRIEKVYLLTNTDKSNEHFSIDPREQLAAVKDMRENKIVPLGNFHSHPETPARPSVEDIRLAYDSSASYLILSLAESEPVLRAFHIEKGEATPETIEFRN